MQIRAHQYPDNEFRPGDIVYRRKGLVQHHGLVMDDGSVFHNTPSRGEHCSSINTFSKGKDVRRVKQSDHTRGANIENLHVHLLGSSRRSYHWRKNNCEHTVSRATGDSLRSPQLLAWTAGSLVAAGVLILTRNPVWAVSSFLGAKSLTHKLFSRTRDKRK